jgi:hypothetical protein
MPQADEQLDFGDAPPSAASLSPMSDSTSGALSESTVLSKSQIVRQYLSENPDARNKEVAQALAASGVTAADVANVKAIDKKKLASGTGKVAGKPGKKVKARGSMLQGAERLPAIPAESIANGAPEGRRNGRRTSGAEIALADLDAGLAFIEAVGSVERGKQVIELIERIRRANLV